MADTQDSQLVLLLLKLEILDQETLDKALAIQTKAKEEGKSVPLGAILVQEKFVPYALVERLVDHQKDTTLVCKSCQTKTGAAALDPREPFICPSCSEPFPETDTAMEAFMTIVQESGPAPARGIQLGQKLAGCKIDRKIGEGGMGAVYQATHEHLERKVAVKVLPEYHAHQPGFADRFLRESRSAAKVMHPNVVQVMDAGIEGETHYIIMEYVEGKSLEEILQEEGRIPIPRALKYIKESALGLRAASEHGIVHRDIKPDNIRINPRGVAKVADFGLAKDLEASQRISTTGAVMGTPLYMSPEQAQGEPVDFRSDIYSLGATLYHLIVGRPPFKGPSALVILQKHTQEDPTPLVESIADCPAEVNALVLRMMAKKPEDRFGSYSDLVDAIDDILGGAPGGRRKAVALAPAKRKGRWPIPAVAAVVILAAVGGWLATRGGGEGTPPSRGDAAIASTDRTSGTEEPAVGPEGVESGESTETGAVPTGETGEGAAEIADTGEGDTGGAGGEETGAQVPPVDPERFKPVAREVRFFIDAHGDEGLRWKFTDLFEEFGLKISDDRDSAAYVVDLAAKFSDRTHPIDKTEGTQLSLRVKVIDASTNDQIFSQGNDPRYAAVFFGDADQRHDAVIDKAYEQMKDGLREKVEKTLGSMIKEGRGVQIVFRGYTAELAGPFDEVQGGLGGVQGVGDVQRRLDGDVLTFELQYAGKIDVLEQALGRELEARLPEDKRPKVTSISDNRIELSF